VSSFQDETETEIEDMMIAFQDTMTILPDAIAPATGSALERDLQEETGDVTVETGLVETIEMIHVSVRDPVEATRLSQDVEQLVTIAENEKCHGK